MPQPATVTHASHWVAHGPPNTVGGASDWCVLASPESQHLAPGGVVLCVRGTTEIHPQATQYAREAWQALALANAWKGARNAFRCKWLPPTPVLTDADVRNANKYTRRAITTKADRAAGEKIIKRPVAVAS